MLQNGDENAYACIKAEILKYPSFAQFQIFLEKKNHRQ
jgi:hypothetical protein